MFVELQRILVPFLIAFFEIIFPAMAIGMLPALWVLGRARQYLLLARWGLCAALFIITAAYWLPMAHRNWHSWVKDKNFKVVSLGIGYAVGVLFAPMLLPEPLRLAKKRLHSSQRVPGAHAGEPGTKVRRRRRKRRTSAGD